METAIQYPQIASKAVVSAPFVAGSDTILTTAAIAFITQLHQNFNASRLKCLEERKVVQRQIDAGQLPDFLPDTAYIRNSDWTIAPVPRDLRDRRVEITGPVERKMIINALNSGANVFMADFEDSNTPSWVHIINGQINLKDAVDRSISYENPETGKKYVLNPEIATLMVRPRGWHLEEKHVTVDGEAVSGALFDFGLYFFTNARQLLHQRSGVYCYLPKIESYKEARLWNQVFEFSEDYLHLPKGIIRATVLIETILASFQMHEILWELHEHSAGLNCGRWDYIFSFIKKFKNRPGYIFPERSQVTMTAPCMRAYTQLVIQTCHRRGAHAIGGMAAQIPIKGDEAANDLAMQKVRTDKLREVLDGHDGTWVAHPGLVSLARSVFDKHMTAANQIDFQREDFSTSADKLLRLPEGTITEEGLRLNINVGILYIESWLSGNGAAALYDMMEDAATAEISRIQVWQWLKAGVALADGRLVTEALVYALIEEETEKIQVLKGAAAFKAGRFKEAITLFATLVTAAECAEFLTLPAYALID